MRLFRIALITLLVLSIVSLACNLPLLGEAPPTPSVSNLTPAANSWDELKFEQVEGEEENELVKLFLDESHITEIVASELQDLEGASIRDVQVFLREGQVQVFGNAQVQGISADSRIILTPQVDLMGKPHFEIVSAHYSLFPLPDDIIANLQVSINQTLISYLEPMISGISVTKISISEGLMTITGREK